MINWFGPIAHYGLYLPNVASPRTVKKLLTTLETKACTSWQKEAIRYVNIDILSLDIIIEELKDSWSDLEINEYSDRVLFFINLIVEDSEKKPFSEKLQSVFLIFNGLTKKRNPEPYGYQEEMTDIYRAIRRCHITLQNLKEIVSFINNTAEETAEAYGDLTSKTCKTTIYNLLKNELVQTLEQSGDDRNANYTEYLISRLKNVFEDYIYHVNVELLRTQCGFKLSSKDKISFDAICNSKEIISSISELKAPLKNKYFFQWLPELIAFIGQHAIQDLSIKETFKICYSEYVCVLNCYDDKNLNYRTRTDVFTHLKEVIEFENENKKITLTAPDDEQDSPYYGLTHPKRNFDGSAYFDYTVAIRNIENYFKTHDRSDMEDILLFLPHVKLLRGKRISSFKYGYGQVIHIVYYVQVEDNTRKKGFSYESGKLQKGERSIITSIDFVPSKEGVWEFLLLVCLKEFTVVTSEQSIPSWFTNEKATGVFSSWNFVPCISETDDCYFITFVKYVFGGSEVYLLYVKYSIGKSMPHSINSEILDSVSKPHGILF